MSLDLYECIAASEPDIERLATESPVGASCAFSIGGRPAVHVFVTADAEVAARFAKCAVAGAMSMICLRIIAASILAGLGFGIGLAAAYGLLCMAQALA